MNQILSVENTKKKKRKNKTSGEPIEIKKIIMIFAIITIVFGVTIIGGASYSIYKKAQNSDTPTQPVVELNQITEKQVQIKATYDSGIEKVTYTWGENGEPETIYGNGNSVVTKTVTIPDDEENSILKVYAESVSGQTITQTEDFTEEKDIDISFEASGQDINVIIESKNELAYMTYRWGNEEEQTISLEGQDNVEQKIPISENETHLTVAVVDINNTTEIQEKQIVVTTRPKVEVTRNEQNKLVIKASDENSIKTVEFTLNGTDDYVLHYDQILPAEERKEIEFNNFSLPEEETEITVIVYNESGVDKEVTLTI